MIHLRKIFFLLVPFLILLIPSISSAQIDCSKCYVGGDCNCNVPDCGSGVARIYHTSDCTFTPFQEKSLSVGSFTYSAETEKNVFVRALCTNGLKTTCTEISVIKKTLPISCKNCTVGKQCECTVDSCKNGVMRVYKSIGCTGTTSQEISVVNYSAVWKPDRTGFFYFTLVCENFTSDCGVVNVTAESPATSTTTTTTVATTTTTSVPSQPENNPSGGNINYSIILAVFAFLIISLLLVRLVVESFSPHK